MTEVTKLNSNPLRLILAISRKTQKMLSLVILILFLHESTKLKSPKT